jgi:hypothetical protein
MFSVCSGAVIAILQRSIEKAGFDSIRVKLSFFVLSTKISSILACTAARCKGHERKDRREKRNDLLNWMSDGDPTCGPWSKLARDAKPEAAFQESPM